MSTEFNYVVNLDTTRIMGQASAMRSQIGMALGGAAPSAMQYSPTYGMPPAVTGPMQEGAIHAYGAAAAQGMRPPGVSAVEYALGVEKNRAERQLESRHQAGMAAQSAFYSGAAGLVAGDVAFGFARPVGAAVGGRIASRFLGSGAAGAGRFIGGFGLGIAAYGMAEEEVGGRIREHFASVERIAGVTRELGQIAGQGRGLTRPQQTELGIAARKAAGDIGMDVQEMGDILSLGRGMGILPSATDPSKARQQFADFAKAVDEGAQILHTSLASAMQVIKSTTAQGMTADQGILRVAAMGGPAAYNRYMAFGGVGAGVARQQNLTGAQGFGLFTAGISQAAGAGITGEETRILGGRYGVAGLIGAGQMAAATSPMGDLQLMAAAGGGPLGGLMDLPGAAIGAMGAGGDFMTNMMKFQVHKDELRRGVGTKGIQAMARHQLVAGADLLESMGFGGTSQERQRFWAQNTMGMDPTQAEAFVGGMGRGGGGGPGAGGMGRARAMIAMQGATLSRMVGPAPTAEDAARAGADSGFGLGSSVEWAIGGGLTGGVPGAVVAGGAALLKRNWDALGDLFGGGGPGLFASATEKAEFYEREQAQQYEAKVSAAKAQMGFLDIDPGIAARSGTANLAGARLDFAAAGSPIANTQSRAVLSVSGIRPVPAGPGTTYMGAGTYYSTGELQERSLELLKPQQLKSREKAAAESVAFSAARRGGGSKEFESRLKRFEDTYEMVSKGPQVSREFFAAQLPAMARGLVNFAGEGPAREALLEEMGERGVTGGRFRHFAGRLLGKDLEELPASFMAGRAVAVGAEGAIEEAATQEQEFLAAAFGTRQVRAPLTGERAAVGRQEAFVQYLMAERGVKIESRARARARDRDLGGVPAMGQNADFDRFYLDNASGAVTPTQADALEERFYRKLTEHPLYQQSKDAILGGDEKRAQRLMTEARDKTWMDNFQDFSGMRPRRIDVNRQVWRRDMEAVTGPTSAVLGTIGAIADVVTKGKVRSPVELVKDVPLLGKMLSTSFAEEVKRDQVLKDIKKPRRRRRRRRAATMERAIGFGQQESAMTTINRSLRRTHKMLKSLHGKIEEKHPAT